MLVKSVCLYNRGIYGQNIGVFSMSVCVYSCLRLSLLSPSWPDSQLSAWPLHHIQRANEEELTRSPASLPFTPQAFRISLFRPTIPFYPLIISPSSLFLLLSYPCSPQRGLFIYLFISFTHCEDKLLYLK